MANGLSDSQPGLREAEDADKRKRAEEARNAEVAEAFRKLAPEIRRVQQEYKENNSEAFACVEPNIAGMIEILPFTPKMFIDLEGANNAFLGARGTTVTAGDLAAFLWRCSPHYTFGKPDSVSTRRFFNGNLYVVPFPRACDDVTNYILRAWAGMPLWRRSGSGQDNLAQWPSRLVHMFAKEYGWTEEYILNLPFRRLWQYANRVLESQDPDYRELCNAAMKLRSDFLKQMNEGKN